MGAAILVALHWDQTMQGQSRENVSGRMLGWMHFILERRFAFNFSMTQIGVRQTGKSGESMKFKRTKLTSHK